MWNFDTTSLTLNFDDTVTIGEVYDKLLTDSGLEFKVEKNPVRREYTLYFKRRSPDFVKKIIHSGPCTIVFWIDGTKTIVRLKEGEKWDEYTAFTAALAKKMFGTTSSVRKILKDKTLPEIIKEE